MTFETSASEMDESESLEAKDALYLLEVPTMLHFSELPLQIFEITWKSSQEVCKTKVDKNGAIDTSVDWHVSQLPGFAPTKLDEWDHFRLQEVSGLLASLFLIIKKNRSTGS